jgi:hypothetical protein
MKICNFDLTILVILMFIVNFFYDKINKYLNINEGFDATSDVKAAVNSLYNADIEAIRNLSSIASKLIAGGITIPGQITVGNSKDNVSSSISDSKYDGNSLCIVGQGDAPNRKVTMWDNVQINGKLSITGISTGAITSDDWFRVKGVNGLYFQDFGGGWSMSDTTWIRSYNGKNVYCNQEIRANRMSTEANIVAEGTITQKTAKFQQRLDVAANKSYVITHNLNLPVWLFTIKIIFSDGTGSYDITGLLTNSGWNHSYGIKLLDNNRFILFTGTGAVAVVRNANIVGSFGSPDGIAPGSGTYDIYII